MSDELVTIATFRFAPEADVMRLLLEAEGFNVFLADVTIVTMDWMLGLAVGNIKLQVPSSQAEQAAQLVEQIRAENKRQAAEDDETGADHCLSCGAEMPENDSKCPKCGWSYR